MAPFPVQLVGNHRDVTPVDGTLQRLQATLCVLDRHANEVPAILQRATNFLHNINPEAEARRVQSGFV